MTSRSLTSRTAPARRGRRILWIAPVFALALAAIGLGREYLADQPRRIPLDTTFTTIDGERLSLADLAGRPVLVTFWATSCPACVREIPQLANLYRELGPRGLALIAVAMPYDPPDRVVRMARARAIPYTVALDVQGQALSTFAYVPATPTTFLLGPGGTVILRKVGAMEPSLLRTRIRSMLEKPSET